MNQCFDPAFLNLPTGYNLQTVYDVTGSGGAGELTSVSTVSGPEAFEGQTLTKVTATTALVIAQGGMTVTLNTATRAYQNGDGQSITSYGALATGSTSGLPVPVADSASKQVNTPPFVDRIYTLALGDSITQTETTITTVTAPMAQAPTTASVTVTTKYVANESITVFGKAYSTCKYETRDAASPNEVTTLWYIVGKGVPAKIVASTGTSVLQLKSGSYNGTPL